MVKSIRFSFMFSYFDTIRERIRRPDSQLFTYLLVTRSHGPLTLLLAHLFTQYSTLKSCATRTRYENDMYRGTQRPPFPQTESQHNSFKLLCCDKFFTTQQFKTVVLWKLSQRNGSGIPYCKLFMFILGFYTWKSTSVVLW